LTVEEARRTVEDRLTNRIKNTKLQVSIEKLSFSSNRYYVIVEGGGYGEQVYRFPITASETVLDALTQLYAHPAAVAKREIWLARRKPGNAGNEDQVFLVLWDSILNGDPTTNYALLPGDRIHVADNWMVSEGLCRSLTLWERVQGVWLLCRETINSRVAPQKQ
jgi:polysaccharide export outer membrane protein